MSCNGCRILRKGCNENCILRQSLQGIENPQAQANATLFVAKFFGRACLMSFLSSVPVSQRPALFQSLLFEACGRTVNPVNGAVGLLWSGNWEACQAAVETVLRGGTLRPLLDFCGLPEFDEALQAKETDFYRSYDQNSRPKRKDFENVINDISLGLTSSFPGRMTGGRRVNRQMDSPESETTTLESGIVCHDQDLQQDHHAHDEAKILRLFF